MKKLEPLRGMKIEEINKILAKTPYTEETKVLFDICEFLLSRIEELEREVRGDD